MGAETGRRGEKEKPCLGGTAPTASRAAHSTSAPGNDVMYAGLNDGMIDTFVFNAADFGSAENIHEFVAGQDKLQ